MLARRTERQDKYGRLYANCGHLGTASAGAQLFPPVHLQLLASPWQTLPTGKSPDHAARSIYRIKSLSLYREVCVPVEAAETAQKQHQLLSAALSGLHVWQSNELLSRQLTLLPGLLLEQLQQISMVICTAARATNGPSHFPVHTRHRAEWTGSAGIFLNYSPLLMCIVSLCGKTTSMCPSLRYSHLPLASDPQHLNRQTSPQPALSPLAISPPAASCLRPIHPSISPLGS